MSRQQREPAPIPWAEKAAAWGLDPAAVTTEPPVHHGPSVGVCEALGQDGLRCRGQLHESEDDEWFVVECDTCGFSAARAQKRDPAVVRQRRIDAAGVPARFLGLVLEQTADNAAALAAIRDWLAGDDPSAEREDRLRSLLPAPALFGLPGRGKSHALAAIAVRLIERDLGVLFRSARQLLREFQHFEDPAERERSWRRAVTVDVLVLDDVGAQQDTEWRHEQLADLVDERYQEERPIVLASNFPPSAWEQVMDERTRSRLLGMTFSIEVRGRDRRMPTGPR